MLHSQLQAVWEEGKTHEEVLQKEYLLSVSPEVYLPVFSWAAGLQLN